MKKRVSVVFCQFIFALLCGQGGVLKVDGHHFTDKAGKPVWVQGDTEWDLFREFSVRDADSLLSIRKRQGFNLVQVMVTGVFPESDSFRTIPFKPSAKAWVDGDPLKPDEHYFKRADSIVSLAASKGITIVILVYHTKDQQNGRVTMDNARAWAKWLAARYADYPNIMWSMAPNAKENAKGVMDEILQGLKEGDGSKHLVTAHPDPGPNSTSFFGDRKEFAYNTIQTFDKGFLNNELVRADYFRVPVKPVVNGEARYEGEAGTTDFDVRRSAYFSVLGGGSYVYGAGGNWMEPKKWREWVDLPGARQMKIMKDIFRGMEWWKLVPALEGLINGDRENALAISEDGGSLYHEEG